MLSPSLPTGNNAADADIIVVAVVVVDVAITAI